MNLTGKYAVCGARAMLQISTRGFLHR